MNISLTSILQYLCQGFGHKLYGIGVTPILPIITHRRRPTRVDQMNLF